jgi:hypothetical protein
MESSLRPEISAYYALGREQALGLNAHLLAVAHRSG